METKANGRKGRPKVKSGCRTCKLRRVKCDEGRPACQRCVSTGRHCDGYGIWGGGSKAITPPQDSPPSAALALSSNFAQLSVSERRHFDWFREKTVVKLPASYVSAFWRTLLLQAVPNDPALLHATLALSSIQRRETMAYGAPEDPTGEEEQFAIRHYVKSIGLVRSHLTTKDKSLQRMVLLNCATFFYFEALRGYFETAQAHYKNGLNAMLQSGLLQRLPNGVLYHKSADTVDDWIIEAFSRLHLQIELLRYFGPGPHQSLQTDSASQIPVGAQNKSRRRSFGSFNEAWKHLQHLMNEIFLLTNQARKQPTSNSNCDSNSSPCSDSTLLSAQQALLRADLATWLPLYQSLVDAPVCYQDGISCETATGHRLIKIYHTMAGIMLETCLAPGNEAQYDLHTDRFLLMMSQLLNMWSTAVLPTEARKYRGLPVDRVRISRSTGDIGCVPLLFYLAIKCRVHRVRMQAIRFLDVCGHREGIWDAKTMGFAARKVVELEEQGFYDSTGLRDDFPLMSVPTDEELAAPALPEEQRMSEVEVGLSGAPMDRIVLTCTQRRTGDLDKIYCSEFDCRTRSWIDLTSE